MHPRGSGRWHAEKPGGAVLPRGVTGRPGLPRQALRGAAKGGALGPKGGALGPKALTML